MAAPILRNLAGKRAVITGSTSGIGLGIAKSLAARGANILLNGFGEQDHIEAVRATLEKEAKVTVQHCGADIATEDGATALLAAVETQLGGPADILVNNAGIQHVAPLDAFPTDKWHAIIQLNLNAVFYTTRAALPAMKQAGWGRIVNIASAHGLVASPFKSAYCASKHGVIGMTKSVALETAESGVTVNCICPGYVRTPLVEQQIPDTAKARGITEEEVVRDVLLVAQATKQFVTVDQLGALAAFLCSNDAASMTGSSVSMDGGWTAQ